MSRDSWMVSKMVETTGDLWASEMVVRSADWKEPMMAAGGDTFIEDMLRHCHLQNVFEDLNRYPEISASQLATTKPDYIFLSSEPFPFKEKHMAEFRDNCPNAEVVLVDGEMFSWYGSRLLKAPTYFEQLLEQIRA